MGMTTHEEEDSLQKEAIILKRLTFIAITVTYVNLAIQSLTFTYHLSVQYQFSHVSLLFLVYTIIFNTFIPLCKTKYFILLLVKVHYLDFIVLTLLHLIDF